MEIQKNEVATRPETDLPDAEDLKLEDEASFKQRQTKVCQLWLRRFQKAKDYRQPFIDRNLRLYRLYRAYRERVNYAYHTSIMPPIGFEIVETIKPRLAAAEVSIDILPTKAEDLDSDTLERWDDLVEYNLQETGFDDKKIDWIDNMLKYANSPLQLKWNGELPDIEVVDGFLFYPDPQASKLLDGSRWEIKQIFKSKAVIEKEEKARGDNPLYILNIENDEGQPTPLIDSDMWKEIEDEQPQKIEDPRRQRHEVNARKMGQIDSNTTKEPNVINEGEGGQRDKDEGERELEIWECWDHVEGKLQVIFNRKFLVRDEDNPYADINEGQVFIDLPCISVPHEYHAIGILEPVETTIHEIADSRNQAMDNMVYNLDPIRKVRQGQGYKTEDLKQEPGATWFLKKADDVAFDRPPEVSRMWVEKDTILRREIQTSLALSEYTQGLPNSGQEPSSKVELLLMQTNIRFSLMVRQLEIAMTKMVNGLIQLNQEFLEDEVAFRLLGDDVRFGKFTLDDKKVVVDSRVRIKPKREKSPEQESEEVMEMYKLFVVDDKPGGGTEVEEKVWKKKKNLLQRLIVEKMGYEAYADILAPEMKEEEEEKRPTPQQRTQRPQAPASRPPALPPGAIREGLPQPVAALPLERTALPGMNPSMTGPPPGGGGLAGMLARLVGNR